MGQSFRSREVVSYAGIRVDLISEGRGPLVVLLPSRGRDSEDFDELASRLAWGGYRVLRPQPRGAGLSVGPVEGITLGDLAADVAFVIEREKAGSAVVAGHAFGTWVARMLAKQHPGLVRGIVLLAAAAKDYPSGLREVVDAAGNATLPREERLAALRKGFFLAPHDPVPWLSGWAKDAIAAQAVAVAATPQATYWDAGGVAMLDVIGEHDPFRPRASWGDARDLAGDRASVVTIADASHALIAEQPEAVANAMLAWIRRL